MAQEEATPLALTGLIAGVVALIGVVIPAVLASNLIAMVTGALAMIVLTVGVQRERPVVTGVGVLAVFVAGLYFWSPWWHGVLYGLAFVHPGVLQWLVVGALSILLGVAVEMHRKQLQTDSGILPAALFYLGIAFMIGGLILAPVVGSIYAQTDMAGEVSNDVEPITELPEVDSQEPRALPQAVASNYARNSLQTPRYNLAGGDITMINGTPHWSYSLAPDGLYNSWRIQQDGAVYVRMTTQDKDVTVARDAFTYGQGMMVFDNYKWQMLRDDYTHAYTDPFVVKHDDSLLMVVPYVDHDHRFRLTPVPQVYSVPEFGGVKVIHQDGTIEDLSPEEARADARLREQNFYPYSLAHFKVNSMRYQHGALNKWFTHRDQLQLAEVPGQGNGQPFTVMTEERGLTYFFAAEPWGEDTHGVYQVWVVDARSGEMERITYDTQNSLLGPAKATRFVRQEHPNYQWVSGGEGDTGNIEVSEPLPVVVDGTLYWQVFVVPTDSAGVAQVSYVNSETGAVTSVETDGQIQAFLEGRTVPDEREGDENDTADGSGGSLVITIEYPDGSTETVTVPEGSSVTVERQNNTTA